MSMVIFHIKHQLLTHLQKGSDNLFVLVSMPNRSLPKTIQRSAETNKIKINQYFVTVLILKFEAKITY